MKVIRFRYSFATTTCRLVGIVFECFSLWICPIKSQLDHAPLVAYCMVLHTGYFLSVP